MDFEGIKKEYDRLASVKGHIERSLDEARVTLDKEKQRYENALKAREIIQIVAQNTQEKLQFHISSLVTTALQSVSKEWPEFAAKIVVRRNQTECDLVFIEDGVECNPIDSSGGGPLDVASFALRIAYWSLNKNRPTFWLDEPFKFVSPNLQPKVSQMLKMLCDELKIQIIMISHADEINYRADRTFNVDKVGMISHVSEKDED